MVELLAYDADTPDRLPEHSFTQDHPQFRGIITHEDVLPLDARRRIAVQFLLGVVGPARSYDGVGVGARLQQSRYAPHLPFMDARCLVLEENPRAEP